jgi:hypothetical protein
MKRFRLFIPLTILSCVFVMMAFARATETAAKDGGGPLGIFVVNGSPVHDVGNLRVHASNWGAIGSMPGGGYQFSYAPSAEWPAGSGVEYLYVAGLWVGGLVNGVPAVSTSAFEIEFRPSLDVRDKVYETTYGAAGGLRTPSASADDDGDGSIDEDRLDGFDNDGDGLIDEDFAAVSDQMLSRIFRDDTPSATQIYPQHVPMHLEVSEESYQFSHPDYDDFVGFTFRITNKGTEPVTDAYVGVFADGDVGRRNRPNPWLDDATAYAADIPVDHGVHGMQGYDFGYWYDADGDSGQAPGYAGIVILDHPTDPSGATAPQTVGAVTYANFSGSQSFEDGGDPTNDFERYELLSSRTIDRSGTVPRDYRSLIAVGPFAAIAPGQTIEFSIALVVTPRDDFTNVRHAAEAYHGLWFDLDHNSGTGIDGREHQEHWYLPNSIPVPVAITRFAPRVEGASVHLRWETWKDAGLAGFQILRAEGSGLMHALGESLSAASRDYVDRSVQPGTRYDYVLVAHETNGSTVSSQRMSVVVPAAELALRPNVPNPFVSATMVGFTLPQSGHVDLAVYDVAGRRVATLFTGVKGAGDHSVPWNGVGDDGRRVSAGIYFCRIQAGNTSATRKLVVMR